eukprot:scaffold88151_cov48-Attheya_sp.AAC.2
MTTIQQISAHGSSDGNPLVASHPGGNQLNPSPLLNPQASTSPWISDPKHTSKKGSSAARPNSYKSPARTTATRSANSFSDLANQEDNDDGTGDDAMYDTDSNLITSTIITPATATPPSPKSPSKKKLKKAKKAQKKILSAIETAAADDPNISVMNASKIQEDKDLAEALAITEAIRAKRMNARIAENKIKKATKKQKKKDCKLAQDTKEATETRDERAAARNAAKEDANSAELDEVTSIAESPEATKIANNRKTSQSADVSSHLEEAAVDKNNQDISANEEANILAPSPIPATPRVVLVICPILICRLRSQWTHARWVRLR